MTLAGFRRALETAIHLHYPDARVAITESRGITLVCRVDVADDVFLAVYFSALTGNTSYALIRQGQRVAGYDNHRFWHMHPLGAAEQHIPCEALSPEQAIARLAAMSL